MPHPRRKCYHHNGRHMMRGEGVADLLKPLAKFIGPLILAEAAKFGISRGIRSVAGKKRGRHTGRGFAPAGAGLRLAGGRGHGRRKKRKPVRGRHTSAVMKARMARVRAFKR